MILVFFFLIFGFQLDPKAGRNCRGFDESTPR